MTDRLRFKVVFAAATLTAGIALYMAAIVLCIAQALADPASPPSPVISTGGNTSGGDPGSGCVTGTPFKAAPDTRTVGYLWAEPDWPGLTQVSRPSSPPAGCSR